MVLDGNTLVNLDLLENAHDGGRKGTLLALVDTTTTAMGRRRFRQWLAAPLLRARDVADRTDAVENLMAGVAEAPPPRAPGAPPLVDAAWLKTLRDAMRGLPDLDRLLARVAGMGSAALARDHPDAKAIYYEVALHDKRKVSDFQAAVRSFRAANAVRALFHAKAPGGGQGALLPGVVAPMLRRAAHAAFPDLAPLLAFFDSAYESSDGGAAAAGKAKPKAKDYAAGGAASIVPARGTDAEYDAAVADAAAAVRELEAYLVAQKAALRCAALEWTHGAKAELRFQLTVPDGVAKSLGASYALLSKTKKVWRYHTPTIERHLAALLAAEARRDAAVKDGLRRLFARFYADAPAWHAAAKAVATLDCLVALADWSAKGDGGAMCRAELLVDAGGDGAPAPPLRLDGARHPAVARALATGGALAATLDACGGSTTFIPNSVELGGGAAGTILLTGPNMGGKSTYLRTACTAVVLAQLGAYVPAARAALAPVDRIFTRVGASDRILAGQSTFFVELAETAVILKHATRASLVVLDELGRGTSTFDGVALAFAVTQHLTTAVRARTLFATHYHTLCDDFAHEPAVALGHMDALIDEGADGAPPKVTFLYTFAPGACPKSYGLNSAARARAARRGAARAARGAANPASPSPPPRQSRRSRACRRRSLRAPPRSRPSSRRPASRPSGRLPSAPPPPPPPASERGGE